MRSRNICEIREGLFVANISRHELVFVEWVSMKSSHEKYSHRKPVNYWKLDNSNRKCNRNIFKLLNIFQHKSILNLGCTLIIPGCFKSYGTLLRSVPGVPSFTRGKLNKAVRSWSAPAIQTTCSILSSWWKIDWSLKMLCRMYTVIVRYQNVCFIIIKQWYWQE